MLSSARGRIRHYILIGQTPVAEPDLLKWAEWMQSADTVVARNEIGGSVVSTVFLGFDHNWFGGRPLIFETMVFTDGNPVSQRRCSTWLEAEEQHAAVASRLILSK